jgi:metal-sulfur cluster biosynthetic enzyme
VTDPTTVPRPNVSSPELVGDDLDSVAIMNVLRGVIDPEFGDNVVDLGMVKRLERGADGAVHVTISLTTAGCPLRAQLMRDAKARVGRYRESKSSRFISAR